MTRLRGKRIDVWPYSEPIFPPDTFVRMWNGMIDDKTLRRVFFEHEQMTFPELIRFFDPGIHPDRLLLLYTDKDGSDAGFGWFDDVRKGLRALCNICMRKSHWGDPATEAARISLDYIFHAFEVRHVFGLTPVRNRMAIAQALRLGFRKLATIPQMVSYQGEPCDVLLTCLSREKFHGRG